MRNTCRLAVTGKLRGQASWKMPKASTYKGSVLPAVPVIKPNLIKNLLSTRYDRHRLRILGV